MSRREQQEEARRQAEDDIRNVLGTPAGRRLLWRIIAGSSAAFGPSFTADALTTAYNEGRRAVGIDLLVQCQKAAPVDYVKMLTEHMKLPEEAPPTPEE